MALPANTQSSSAWNAGGGGRSDHARQKRCNMIHGSSQARTSRSAAGQLTLGRGCFDRRIFFSRRPPVSSTGRGRAPFALASCRLLRLIEFDRLDLAAGQRPPAKGEGATHQLPVAADGVVGAHLILGPAQALLDLLVALLDPGAQAVQARDLGQVRRRQRALLRTKRARGWQVGRQIPGCLLGQLHRVGGHDYQALRTLRSVHPADDFEHPPRLTVSVSEFSYDLAPLAQRVRLPRIARHELRDRARFPFGMPPAERGRHRHDVAHPQLVQPADKLVVLAVEAVRHDCLEGHARLVRTLHQLQRERQLGAKARIFVAARKPVRRRVRLDFQRVVEPLVRPERVHRHHTVVDLADTAQILAPNMRGAISPLAVAGLIDGQNTSSSGRQHLKPLQQLSPQLTDRRRIPVRLGQEPLQALHLRLLRTGQRLGVRQCGERLVALRRQQQPFQIAPERFALVASRKQTIKLQGEIFQWTGRGSDIQAFRHAPPPPPVYTRFFLESTNHFYVGINPGLNSLTLPMPADGLILIQRELRNVSRKTRWRWWIWRLASAMPLISLVTAAALWEGRRWHVWLAIVLGSLAPATILPGRSTWRTPLLLTLAAGILVGQSINIRTQLPPGDWFTLWRGARCTNRISINRDGTAWCVNARNELVYKFDVARGVVLETHSVLQAWDILAATTESVWVTSEAKPGFTQIHPGQSETSIDAHPNHGATVNNQLWIVDGLSRLILYENGNPERHFTTRDGLLNSDVLTVETFPDGSLWVGSWSGVSQLVDPDFNWKGFRPDNELDGPVVDIASTGDGMAWILHKPRYVSADWWLSRMFADATWKHINLTDLTGMNALRSKNAIARDGLGRLWIVGFNIFKPTDNLLAILYPDGSLALPVFRLRRYAVPLFGRTRERLPRPDAHGVIADGNGGIYLYNGIREPLRHWRP